MMIVPMKKNKFTQEQKMLHHLILHSHDVPTALGLFNGMTGIMLVLAHYARVRQMPIIETVSDYLMEQITKNIAKSDSIFLGDGMAGIGWGIEYLIQRNYMKGCGVELTKEIDDRIMEIDVRRMKDFSVEKGLTGLFYYVIAHLQGATLQGRTAFDRQYIGDWIWMLRHLNKSFPQDDKWIKMSNMLSSILNGENKYQLDLVQFAKPMKRATRNFLGLHNGLAGYLEQQLHNDKSI
jgi:hypothetical protein